MKTSKFYAKKHENEKQILIKEADLSRHYHQCFNRANTFKVMMKIARLYTEKIKPPIKHIKQPQEQAEKNWILQGINLANTIQKLLVQSTELVNYFKSRKHENH